MNGQSDSAHTHWVKHYVQGHSPMFKSYSTVIAVAVPLKAQYVVKVSPTYISTHSLYNLCM
jgi:hypothetical protein